MARPPDDLSLADIGLTLAGGKALLRAIQDEIVLGQISGCSALRGTCPHRGRLRRRKDFRLRTLHTVFGSVLVGGHRSSTCPCEHWIPFVASPIGEVLTGRCTPELAVLHMPFRKAAKILGEFLPFNGAMSHETVRRRTHAVAERIEVGQATREAPPGAAAPEGHGRPRERPSPDAAYATGAQPRGDRRASPQGEPGGGLLHGGAGC